MTNALALANVESLLRVAKTATLEASYSLAELRYADSQLGNTNELTAAQKSIASLAQSIDDVATFLTIFRSKSAKTD
jgi:hypothetical protein